MKYLRYRCYDLFFSSIGRLIITFFGTLGFVYINITGYTSNHAGMDISYQDLYLHILNDPIMVSRNLILFLPLIIGQLGRMDQWQNHVFMRERSRKSWAGWTILFSIGNVLLYQIILTACVFVIGLLKNASLYPDWSGIYAIPVDQYNSIWEPCMLSSGLFFFRMVFYSLMAIWVNLFVSGYFLGSAVSICMSAIVDYYHSSIMPHLPQEMFQIYHSILAHRIGEGIWAPRIPVIYSFAYEAVSISIMVFLIWRRVSVIDIGGRHE